MCRFDRPKEERATDNLLILWADEAQRFVTASEDGMSDYNCIDVMREAKATLVTEALKAFVWGTQLAHSAQSVSPNRFFFRSRPLIFVSDFRFQFFSFALRCQPICIAMGMSESPKTGGELFIVDNSDEAWKGLKYLQDWTEIASAFDIATGYFEIGALLALDGKWQKLDKIRILMGNEVSARTRQAILDALKQDITARLDASIEYEKEKNDFLTGVAAIVQALRDGKIECRAYAKREISRQGLHHAPARRRHWLGRSRRLQQFHRSRPHAEHRVKHPGQGRRRCRASCRIGMSSTGRRPRTSRPTFLRPSSATFATTRPFDVYAKALDELFRRHELTASEWEKTESKIYPILDQYQRDGYASLYHIAANYDGAFLCDGVGLGKTFIGLMLIERLVMYEKKRVVLFVPKSGREPVWERNIKRYLPHLLNGFLSFKIFNHTDLMRGVSADGTDFPSIFEQMTEQADVVVIDEAHHFRNRGLTRESGGSRYWKLYDLAPTSRCSISPPRRSITRSPIFST